MEQKAPDEAEPASEPVEQFVKFLYNTDVGGEVAQGFRQLGQGIGLSNCQLLELEAIQLYPIRPTGGILRLLEEFFKMWIVKLEGVGNKVTLLEVATKAEGANINSLKLILSNKYRNMDIVLAIPKEVQAATKLEGQAETPSGPEGTVGKELSEKDKEVAKKGIKGFLTFKKGKGKGPSLVAGVECVTGKQADGAKEDSDEPKDEVKDLIKSDAQILQELVAPIFKIPFPLGIQEYISSTIYCIATSVPKTDDWIAKITLISLEMLSIIRHFIEPGVAIRRNEFEAVVRRYIVDPGLAPELIKALVLSRMFIPKEGDKKSVILIEPSVKDAIDHIQQEGLLNRYLEKGVTYPPLPKVQEKLLLAVVAAVEEHKSPSEGKAFGKKLRPHISYLVKEIIWKHNHPGFRNVQAKIPKVIRFCTESVIAVSKQRYESLPDVSDDDMALFEKAYAKAQEEIKLDLAGALKIGAGIGVGLGGAALGVAALALDDDD